MRLYLDDDSVSGLLVQLLQAAQHDVQIPADVGLIGNQDVIQLTHAVVEQPILLSQNHDDFEKLHNLVRKTGGEHCGILMVRKDNDLKRDMTPRAVVRAIEKLMAASVDFHNQFVILNQWR